LVAVAVVLEVQQVIKDLPVAEELVLQNTQV
jgi:hypothetical protein